MLILTVSLVSLLPLPPLPPPLLLSLLLFPLLLPLWLLTERDGVGAPATERWLAGVC